MTRQAINTKATVAIHERREPGLLPSHAEIGLLYDDTLRRLSSDRDCEKDAQHDDQRPQTHALFLENLAAVLQQLCQMDINLVRYEGAEGDQPVAYVPSRTGG